MQSLRARGAQPATACAAPAAGAQADGSLPAHRAGRCVAVMTEDGALFELLAEWLATACLQVEAHAQGVGSGGRPCDLLLVELAYPRRDAAGPLQRLAADYPGLPVVALSPTFLAGVEAGHSAARALGVAAVLPLPVSRQVLLAAVCNVLGHNACP